MSGRKTRLQLIDEFMAANRADMDALKKKYPKLQSRPAPAEERFPRMFERGPAVEEAAPRPWQANQGAQVRPTSGAARAGRATGQALKAGGGATGVAARGAATGVAGGAAGAGGGGILSTIAGAAARYLPGMAIGQMALDAGLGAVQLASDVGQSVVQNNKNKKTHTKVLTATSGKEGLPTATPPTPVQQPSAQPPPPAAPQPDTTPPVSQPVSAPATPPPTSASQPAAAGGGVVSSSGSTGGGGPVQFHSDTQPTPGPPPLARKRPRVPDLFPSHRSRKVARTTRSRA
jgi:hypothetical protein